MRCRVCLEESEDTMNIFNKEEENLQIADIVSKHLDFKPVPDDSKTTAICLICWDKLSDFHQFYTSVQSVQKNYALDAKNIKVEQDDKLQEPMEIEATILPDQKNPLNDNDSDSLNFENEPQPNNIEEHRAGNLNAFDEEPLANWIDKKKLKEKRGTRTATRGPKHLHDEIDDALIKKHIPMVCTLCVFTGAAYSDIVKHYRFSHPNERPHVVCCNLKLSKRCYLRQHALNHENPDTLKCHECQKTFSNESVLRAHNLVHHAPEDEKPFPCEKCPLRFATRHLLNTHASSHIPREERNFFCPECPNKKAFASAYSLTTHRHSAHKKEANVCHVCAKTIRDKRCFEKHVRLHFENSGPRIKCPYPGCESYLKDEDNLKGHLKRHNPEGKIYKCVSCDKVCKNAKALASHKRYSHSNEIFQCEECGKTFKRAITLKEHMAQHTGEILYNCPFCTRTFNSNANMHAHKKKTHPKEWNEWRKSKLGIS